MSFRKWLRRAVSGAFLCFLSLTLFLGMPMEGATGWKLWKGNELVGVVPVREDGRLFLVGVRSMADLLGVSASAGKDRLILNSSGGRLELVRNAAAGRFEGRIIPLANPVLFSQGDWWIESRAAARLLSLVMGIDGSGKSLRWAGFQDIDKKKAPSSGDPPQKEKEPQKEISGEEQSSPSEEIDRRLAEMARAMEKKSASRSSDGIESGKKGTAHTGVRRLRWGSQDGFLRAVFDLGGNLKPKVFTKPGKTVVIFNNAFAPRDVGELEPGESIRCSVAYFGDHVTFTFTHPDSMNVRHFALTDPHRYVVDFLLASGASTSDKDILPIPPSTVKPTPRVVPSVPARKGAPLVVVDPGHGGKDPGAVANGLREKDLNLQIAKRLRKHLQAKGCKVRLTREDDRYLKLSQRTALANQWGADIFVSVHINALPAGRHAKGVEIYLMALPSDKDAMQLALIENKDMDNGDNGSAASDKRTRMLLQILGDMQQNAKINESTGLAESMFGCGRSGGLPMRRVAQAPFYVLRGAGMPSVLVEMGFITEKSEARMLRDAGYQEKLARNLAEGIARYTGAGQ